MWRLLDRPVSPMEVDVIFEKEVLSTKSNEKSAAGSVSD
jgi:hypothetical protein